MGIGEPKLEYKQSSDFKGLVEDLINKSITLKERPDPINKNSKLNILDAIENNRITDYTGDNANDKELDAINYLIAIHDELKKPSPDNDFIEETVERLKEYL